MLFQLVEPVSLVAAGTNCKVSKAERAFFTFITMLCFFWLETQVIEIWDEAQQLLEIGRIQIHS